MTLTPEQKAKLKMNAETAFELSADHGRTAGVWMRMYDRRMVYTKLDDGCVGRPVVGVDNPYPSKNEGVYLDFIAAANPATILSLLSEVEILQAALTEIAAYYDTGGNQRLKSTGSYSGFDEPGSVEIARAALGEQP